MPEDPNQADQPEALGKTFGKAAAEDDERVDELTAQEASARDAEQRFADESSEHDIEGAHPPADADDRDG
jgi:hypothetical protein